MNYPRIIFAASQSGAGKTTITLGVMLALRKRGLTVHPFKAGPDYIDPMHHTAVCNNISRNLDSWLLMPNVVMELFEKEAKRVDISVIEGVMGLYDGIRESEDGSSAHLAKILALPVILILNAVSLSRSAAAIALGYKEFDKKVKISGIILNNIGSRRHYRYTKACIEKKTRIPVLGYLPKSPDLKLPERHLGLIPAEEKKLNAIFYRKLVNLIEKNIDVKGIIQISKNAKTLPYACKNIFGKKRHKNNVTIAIARDKAFNFYYQDNLDILKSLGADLVEFSPLKDKIFPPNVNGMYIGGGFPEIFASELSSNINFKSAVIQQARQGLPIYAECGGLMYLVKRLVDFQGKVFSMVGIFEGSVIMAHKRQSLGYIEIEVIQDNILSRKNERIRAHTFHWSYLDGLAKDTAFAYKVSRDQGKTYSDGLVSGNVLASYAHVHFASKISLASNFIRACAVYKGIRERRCSKE